MLNLAEMPLSKRGVLFVVRNDADKVTCCYEGLQTPTACSLATLEEIKSNFPECNTATIGDLWIWDNFTNCYVRGQNFSATDQMRIGALLAFCRDYLGAVRGNVHSEEEKDTEDKINGDAGVKGNLSVPSVAKNEGDSEQKNTSQGPYEGMGHLDGKYSTSDSRKREEKYTEHFELDSPSLFDLVKAENYYTKMGLDRFNEFKTVYEFRKNHQCGGKHTFKWFLYEEIQEKKEIAVEFGMKVQKCLNISMSGNLNKDSASRHKKILEVELEYL